MEASYHKKITEGTDGRSLWKQEKNVLIAVMAVPLIFFCFMALSHFNRKPVLGSAAQVAVLKQNWVRFTKGMKGWQELEWGQKENLVSSAILFFKEEMNAAILKSPGFYVNLINRYVKKNPVSEKQSLLDVLRGMAVMEYDFYTGINADEQAMRFLGPELFAANKRVRQAQASRTEQIGKGGW